MATQTKPPRVGASDAAFGVVAWSNPGNAVSSNNVHATSSPTTASHTRYLKMTDFDFSIPAGATIDGIQVDIERKGGVINSIKDSRVRLVRAGTVEATDKADTSIFWPTTDTSKSYGGAADLWSAAWTPADINSRTFGVVLAASGPAKAVSASVDFIQIIVTYTMPSGSVEAVAGTVVSDAAFGTTAWTNPGNATTENDTNATSTSAATRYLKATNFGLAIPSGASIEGIEFFFRKKDGGTGIGKDARVRAVKADGTVSTTDKADVTNHMNATLKWKSYGGVSDLWGESWAEADIEDADFGVVIAESTAGKSTAFGIDSVKVIVYYSSDTTTPQTITGVARIEKSVSQTITGKAAILKTVARTVTGLARITKSVAQTVQGLARITASTSRTIQGVADILATTSRTITGVARIQKVVNQTVQGLARITAATTRTIQGVARITVSTSRTITGLARITASTLRTIQGVSRIQTVVAQTITGVAKLADAAVQQTIDGVARITVSTSRTIQGVSRIQTVVSQTISGLARITKSVAQTIAGVARIEKSTQQTVQGKARVTVSTSRTVTGKARIQTLVSRTITGLARITTSVSRTIQGVARITVSTSRNITGVSRIQNVVPRTILGVSRIQRSVLQTIQGLSRIQVAVAQTIQGLAFIVYTRQQNITGVARIVSVANKGITVSIRDLKTNVAFRETPIFKTVTIRKI